MLRPWIMTGLTVLVGLLTHCPIDAQQSTATADRTLPVTIAAFPQRGATEDLEPEVLDFRYRPERWQTCIGLIDDLMKSIVGDDGGLYYEYGKRGPEPYDNGQGVFGTRVLASLKVPGKLGPVEQSLLSPRVPLVITRRQGEGWSFTQEAWSVGAGARAESRSGAGRVDYLAIAARNRGPADAAGLVTLDVGSTRELTLDETKTRLLVEGQPQQVFAQFTQPCQEPVDDVANEEGLDARVHCDTAISVQRNWAQPSVSCAPLFRDVLVGFGQSLSFRIDVTPGAKHGVAVGLIEGWHADPGKRPLRIEIEGKVQRTVDPIREAGKNVPLVLSFMADDEDSDGVLRVRILPVQDAEDSNTIVSGLWVFPADAMPDEAALLAGEVGDDVIARVDSTHLPRMPKPLSLVWETGTLAPGSAFELLVALPQSKDADLSGLGDPGMLRRKAIDAWQSADLPYDRFHVPDEAVQALVDSCIRNIYQAREWKDGRPKFQVGPTCYRGTWAADGPFLLEAASYLGRLDEARAGLEQQVDGDDGPGGVEFSKKSGLRLWMIWRHAQLTGDRQWLAHIWPKVEREVSQIIEYRRMTRDDPAQANYGLMPIGFGDGGLGGKHREYTNVYWTLAGLQAAIDMAELTQDSHLEAWRQEFADYWQAFDKARSRDQLTDEAGNTYVPVTMRGEQPQLPQRGAWAFLQAIYPGRIFDPQDTLMRGTLAMLDANQREGLIYGTGWIPDGIWNYAASFYGHAHLWLGHGRKAAATLYAFGNHASPLLCWREEQNVVGDAPHFVGDMPHNWGSAEFIRMVRHLVILERGDALHLFEGLPTAWTRPGSRLEMRDVPTSFGAVSVKMEVSQQGDAARIVVDPPRRAKDVKLVVHLEGFEKPIGSVKANGKVVDRADATIAADEPAVFLVKFER